MKNKLYYLGIAATLLIVGGGLMKIMHWPLAGIMLVIGLSLLALIFIPFSIKSSFQIEADKKLKTMYILFAVVMVLEFIGMLFKIMHWPYSNMILILTLPLPFVVLLPIYLFSNKVDKEINYKNFMAILFFFAYFAAITALLAISVSRNVIDGFIRSAYAFENKSIVLAENTKWLASELKNDTSSKKTVASYNEIIIEADKLVNSIEELKKTLIIANSGNSESSINNDGTINLWKIKNKDSKPYLDLYYFTELKKGINNFRTLLQKNCQPESHLSVYIDDALNTSDDNSDPYNWEKMLFKDKIIVSAIEKLDLLQFKIRLAENETIMAMK